MHYNSRRQSLLTLTISAVLGLILMFASHVSAQTVTGSIYGTVADTSGAVIPGAAIAVTNVGTNEVLATKSNGSGEYVFPILSPGRYKVSSEAPGFSRLVQNDVRLAANQNVNVSFVMKTGATSTTVSVQAGTMLVDTRESTIGTTIDQRQIQDLPLIDRNAYQLALLVPGITNLTAGTQIGNVNGTSLSANGLPENYNSFYLDGSFNTSFYRGGGNLIPNPDALQEFSILTSNQDAEFGQYPGAVINTITRSGTNRFHGVAYDFLRNTDLTAKNYFSNSVTPLVYNIFGGGVGGPAHRNKLFFYLSYEGTRINTQDIVASTSIFVPSALERAGNFTQSAKKPKGPYCGGQYIICIDPVAAAVLKYVPSAIDTADHPAQQNGSANNRADQGVARLDYQLNPAHKLQFTFFQSRGSELYPTANGGNEIYDYQGADYIDNQSNYIVGDNWIISPRLVNSFRASYSLHRSIGDPTVPGARLKDLGSQIPEGDAQGLTTQPDFSITGYFQMGSNNSSNTNFSQLQYGIFDTLYYTKGHHSARFGGELIEQRFQDTSVAGGSTISTFSGNSTGNALADFMEGHATTFNQTSGTFSRLHALDPSLFAQDDWRVTQRLTLDLGVRWEVFYPFAGQNESGTFVPGVQSKRFPTAPIGLLFSGDPGVPDGILQTSYKRFAPRVGFADDLLGNGRLALKGAYGIFYSTFPEILITSLEHQPFLVGFTLNDTTSLVNPYTGIAPYNGVSPFPYTFNPANPLFLPGAGLASLPPYTAVTPYVQEYNLALQQQFGNNWSTQIAYVGNTIRKFFYTRDQNSALYQPGATTSNASIQARRPYQPEGQITEFDAGNTGSYNSLQVSVTRRFANRFSLLASYVWSKTMDIASVSETGVNNLTLADENDPAMDYGPSLDEVPQRFVASYLYALPGVHRYGLFGKEILNGWQINGITSFQSGHPFNIVSNKDTNFDGILTDRPNVTGNPSFGSGRSRSEKIAEYFNKAAYSLPTTGQLYGNSHRNPLIGPGNVDTDLSAFKRFAIYKQSDLLFRGEIFNVFNNVNLGNPDGTFGTANFGKITAAGSPRIVQFALKYEF